MSSFKEQIIIYAIGKSSIGSPRTEGIIAGADKAAELILTEAEAFIMKDVDTNLPPTLEETNRRDLLRHLKTYINKDK